MVMYDTRSSERSVVASHVLRVLVQENGLRDLLYEYLESGDRLAQLAARSYIHQNGFVKMPLFKNETTAVRLHIWSAAGATRWTGNIHDHRFSFWSHVICGKLVQRRWNEAASGEVYSRYRYVPCAAGAQHTLHYEREQALRQCGMEEFKKGQTYSLSSGTIHQTTIMPEETAITLLVEDRLFLRPHAAVFSRRYPPSTLAIDSPVPSVAACREFVESVLRKLQ